MNASPLTRVGWIAVFVLGLASGARAAAPAPDGLFFEKNDHFLTPSESLYFTYRGAGADGAEAVLAGGVEFRVSDLRHNVVAEGVSTELGRVGDLAVFRLLPPERVAELSEGWHDLAVRLRQGEDGNKNYFHIKFFALAGPFERRVVYLMDGVTPEGFALWCHRERGKLIEPLRDFPENGDVDCVVVSTFNPLPDAQLEKLKDHLRRGGRAVFFGYNNEQLDELNPLATNRDDPFPASAQAGADQKAAYLLNATLAPGATRLRASADGAPELAEKAHGDGKVFAYAGALKPGAAAELVVTHGLAMPEPKAPARPRQFEAAAPDADGLREGVSRGNFGRFGWLDNDRTQELSLRPEHTFRMWDVPQDYFGVAFDTAPHEAGRLYPLETNWLGKRLRAAGGRWGEATEIVWGLGTPGVLLRNADARRVSIESPMLGKLAYPTADGIRVADLENGEVPALDKLSKNWFLAWGGGERFDAWPLLFTVNARVAEARVENGRLLLGFVREGIDLTVMPLAGVRHFTPDETRGWENAFPDELAARCEAWSRRLAARTLRCVERYRVDHAARAVTIVNEFDYLELADDWGGRPEYVAPLPPLVAIYAQHGLARAEKTRDLDFAGLHGPLWAVDGRKAEYVLSLPELDYPLPVAPVDPRLDLSTNKALFERIAQHLAVPGMTSLAAGFSVVERDKKRIYPERELREATGRHGPEQAVWKYIDLHRTLAGVTGNLMFKPFLDGVEGFDETRARLEAKIRRNVVRDLSFFAYKTFLRLRREPGTGSEYLMAFMAPVRYNAGYWMFHDMNETIGIFLQTIGLYGLVYGEDAADFLRLHEDYIDLFASHYRTGNDWAWMSSLSVEWGQGNNIDMLNAELSGWAGFVNIKKALGREDDADFGRYMAAKAAVSTGARLLLKDFYNALNFPLPPALLPVIHEMKDVDQARQIRNAYLPLGVSHGYGEGWPSLWPTSITPGLLKHYFDGKDFYSTSKGVPAELLAYYRAHDALSSRLVEYENRYRDAAYKAGAPYLYSRIAGKALVDPDAGRAELENMLLRAFGHPGVSAKSLGSGVADWEVSAMVLLLERLRQTADDDERASFVPVGDERSGKALWETVAGAKGGPAPKFEVVRADREPGAVKDGAVSARLSFPAPAGKQRPAAFVRFDRDAVAAAKSRELVFWLCRETPGEIDLTLPNRDWSRRATVRLPGGGVAGEWTPVRLNLENDLGLAAAGMTTNDLRGELFLYNAGDPARPDSPTTLLLDDIRFEP